MDDGLRRRLARRKRRILHRIKHQRGVERHQPMMTPSDIHYEFADRTRAISPGGIGAIHLLARHLGLVRDNNENLHLLKRQRPYFTSDHILNIASNLLAGGSRLEHIEAASRSPEERSASAKKAAATRKRNRAAKSGS